MSTRPLVSVVIPTRNRQRLLGRALATVLAQRDADVEVFVIDEASTDGTASFVNELGEARVILVRHETPRGVANARNAGLTRARGEWVAFLDDDDLWAPNKLAVQIAAATEAGAPWVCTGSVTVNEELQILSAHRPPSRAEEVPQLLGFNVVPGGGSGAIARTGLAREAGGFDPALNILADWDMWIRLFLLAPPATVHRPLVGYLRHRGNMTRFNEGLSTELAHVIAKHDGARRAFGVDVSLDRWLTWAAATCVRSGRRREAVETYLHVARRYGDLKSLGRGVLAACWPSLILGYWRWNARRRLPGAWYREAEAWLLPIRAGEEPAAVAHRSRQPTPRPITADA